MNVQNFRLRNNHSLGFNKVLSCACIWSILLGGSWFMSIKMVLELDEWHPQRGSLMEWYFGFLFHMGINGEANLEISFIVINTNLQVASWVVGLFVFLSIFLFLSFTHNSRYIFFKKKILFPFFSLSLFCYIINLTIFIFWIKWICYLKWKL